MNVLRSITFIVGLLLAVGAFVAYLVLGGVLNPPPYQVVVAVRDIPPYTVITSDALAVDSQSMSKTVARNLVLKQEVDHYIGGMAIEPIHAGEPLRKSAVISPDNPAASRRLALLLDDPTKAVMVIPVTPETCPEQVQSGDYVHLVASFAPGGIGGGGQSLAEMLATPTPPFAITPLPSPTPTPPITPTGAVTLPTAIAPAATPYLSAEEMTLPIAKVTVQNCKVLAVRRRRVANPAFGRGGQPFVEGDIQAVVVLVPEESVELLTFAIDNGKVHLVLVPAQVGKEEEHDPTLGVAWSDVLSFILNERRMALGEMVEVVPPTATPTPTPEGWLPPVETSTPIPPTTTPAPTPTKAAGVPSTAMSGGWRGLACLAVPLVCGLILVVFIIRIVKRRKAA